MEQIKQMLPTGRVWMAAYSCLRKERFELRTEGEAGHGYRVLWHGKAPFGSSAADFIYIDLNDLYRAADALQKDAAADALRRQAEKLLDKSLYYLPVVAELLNLAAGSVRGTPLRAMNRLFKRYKKWQMTFEKLAENVLSADADVDRPKRYMELCFSAEHEFYPALRYGEISVEPVSIGAPSDDARNWFPKRHGSIVEVLSTTDANQFFCYMVSKYLQAQLRMRRCKYCGRYFVLYGNSKQEYCDRPMEGSRGTCKEAGAMKLYVQRQNTDPAIRAYKRAYKTNYARIAYGLTTKEEFYEWSKQARLMRNKCAAGEISLEDFEAWLESSR